MFWPLLSWATPLPVFCTSQPLAGVREIPLPRSTASPLGCDPVVSVGWGSSVGCPVLDLPVGWFVGSVVG